MAYFKTSITGIGDPFVLCENGTYYLYATSSAGGVKVWKGTDLQNLTDCGLCYVKEHSFGYECFWAPEVVKRRDGKFVMFLTARDRADGVLRTGVAIADSPVGEFCDVILHKPMFDCGTATIDATCFVDDDGSAYLYFVKDCSLNVINGVHTSQIFVAKLTDDLTALASDAVLVASPTQKWEAQSLPASCMAELKEKGATSHTAFVWNEGPAVLKKDGKYYLTYSANCYDSRFYAVGCAVADSPMGKFVKYDDNPVMQWVEGELSGPGHNSFFTDTDGVLWCAFHCHTDYDRPSGDRRFCYCPVAWDKGKLRLLYL